MDCGSYFAYFTKYPQVQNMHLGEKYDTPGNATLNNHCIKQIANITLNKTNK